MAVQGISLKLDEHGNVKEEEQPDGELCSGVVVCANCKNDICSVENKHWADLRVCPFKKWVILVYNKSESLPVIGYPADRCFLCGGKEFWKKKDGPLVCQNCHPSALPESLIERMDITGNKIEPVPEKKKKAPKLSVSVRKGPKQKAKQAQFFS
jgi:hypothetical protein